MLCQTQERYCSIGMKLGLHGRLGLQGKVLAGSAHHDLYALPLKIWLYIHGLQVSDA